MPDDATILGLDIGGTKSAVVLGDRQATVFERVEFPTRTERGFDATFAELCTHVERLRHPAAHPAPEVISVSIGGPLDVTRGIVNSPPNLPGWDRIPLRELLEERFEVPVCIEHDGNAGALAEWHFGAARGCRNVVFLTMGTGFGGGLILNGQLYRGTCDLAGEVGHIRLMEDGPAAFGKTGCWEAVCGGAGIARMAALRFPKRWRDGDVDARQIAELALAGDRDALDVIEEVGRWLGRGLAVLIDVLNPEIVVIGSMAVRLGELVLTPAREELRKEALPGAVEVCRIVPAALGERLGDVASLCAAIEATK